jgi:predicted nucleic acid-binding protein
VIFIDTNVFMYAVGRPHPLREVARADLGKRVEQQQPLATSAEVLQELLHAYLPVGRLDTLDAALRLAVGLTTIWSVEADDVRDGRDLHTRHPGLSARDLLHLSMCIRRSVNGVLTYDRALAAAWSA